ncbi:serine/threonine-protein phosphatase 6 regulatory ankyrin repeat subunit C, partial [Biomphalaria pfeifferi]
EEDPEEYYKYKSKIMWGLTEDEYELMQAVKTHSVQKIRTMLNKGVDPNFFKNSLNRQTPLHLASEDLASEKIVGILLFFSANPNAQDSIGCTPLHLACLHGNAATVELLVQAGADVNIIDNYEETPLLTACKVNRRSTCQIVDKLLEAGAIVSCTNNHRQSVLHILTSPHHFPTRTEVWMVEDRFSLMKKLVASQHRHLLVSKMLRHGLSANMLDTNGLNPLSCELLVLLQAPATESDEECSKLLTAKALLAGGAILQIDKVMNEIDNILNRRTFHTPFNAPDFNNLAELIKESHAVIPRQTLQICLDKIREAETEIDTSSLQAELETCLKTVPSLLQMSKLCLRQCLGNYVLIQTELLPLPDKMKEYICSV